MNVVLPFDESTARDELLEFFGEAVGKDHEDVMAECEFDRAADLLLMACKWVDPSYAMVSACQAYPSAGSIPCRQPNYSTRTRR